MRTAGIVAVILGMFFVTTAPAGAVVTRIPFEGVLDIRAGQYDIRFGAADASSVRLVLENPRRGALRLTADIVHVPAALQDVSAVVKGEFDITGPSREQRELSGSLKSNYVLINSKPVPDLDLDFAVKEGKVIVNAMTFGAFSGHGELMFSGDKHMMAEVELLPVDMEEVLDLLAPDLEQWHHPALTGTVAASMSLNGPLKKPDINARLALYNGTFNKFGYESILLQMKGTYPFVRLFDSTVTQAEGFMCNIAGMIDLGALDKLGAQVPQLVRTPMVGQGPNDRREWVLKRVGDAASPTELKYLLMKNDRGDAEGVIGFEKRIGF